MGKMRKMNRIRVSCVACSAVMFVFTLSVEADGPRGVDAGSASVTESKIPASGRLTRVGAKSTGRAAAASARVSLKSELRTVSSATSLASVGGLPPNDDCLNAETATTGSTISFNNALATEDGFAHTECIDDAVSPLGNITHDLWYIWTSTCDGAARAETCSGFENPFVDTRLAVYRTETCVPGDADLVTLGCNDDFCLLESSVSFLASVGEVFLIRVGSFPGGLGSCTGGSNPGTACSIVDDSCLDGGVCSGNLPDNGGPGELTIFCVDLPCDLPGGNCQGEDPFNGFLSDSFIATATDDFTPAVDADLDTLCWEGSYISDFPSPDQFEVRYFDNVDGLPGSLIGGPFRQNDGSLTVVGPENNATGIDFPVFSYSATHAPVHVEAGDCYWLEIRNDIDPIFGINDWFWQTALTGNGFSLHDAGECVGGSDEGMLCTLTACIGGECPGPNGYDDIDIQQADLSFCLSESLGDVIFCQPPSNGGCAAEVGDCLAEDDDTPISCTTDIDCPLGSLCLCPPGNGNCEPNELICRRTGCEDGTCCNRVCACDPFCCTNGWDSFCALDNLFTPTCDALTRCPSLSGGCTEIVSSVPGHCSIDAGQPSDITGAIPMGISEITLTLNDGCDASVIPSAFYRLLTPDGAVGPNVVGTSPNGNSVVLTLDAPIESLQWTCISHPDLFGRICLGYLPGDVDGDGASNPALDLGALIDCINNPGTCDELQTNIDRDGVVSGVLDITRLIDLFNGAGAFESVTGAMIGACPVP